MSDDFCDMVHFYLASSSPLHGVSRCGSKHSVAEVSSRTKRDVNGQMSRLATTSTGSWWSLEATVLASRKNQWRWQHGPLTRYVKLRVAHAPGMPGTFSPPPQFSDPDMHHGTFSTYVLWRMPGSITSSFLWSQWWGKCSRHPWCMHNPQFYVSGKRPMAQYTQCAQHRHH